MPSLRQSSAMLSSPPFDTACGGAQDKLPYGQAVEHDPDLILGRKMSPGGTPDVLDHAFR
jgi:hypothetical protein